MRVWSWTAFVSSKLTYGMLGLRAEADEDHLIDKFQTGEDECNCERLASWRDPTTMGTCNWIVGSRA